MPIERDVTRLKWLLGWCLMSCGSDAAAGGVDLLGPAELTKRILERVWRGDDRSFGL